MALLHTSAIWSEPTAVGAGCVFFSLLIKGPRRLSARLVELEEVVGIGIDRSHQFIFIFTLARSVHVFIVLYMNVS